VEWLETAAQPAEGTAAGGPGGSPAPELHQCKQAQPYPFGPISGSPASGQNRGRGRPLATGPAPEAKHQHGIFAQSVSPRPGQAGAGAQSQFPRGLQAHGRCGAAHSSGRRVAAEGEQSERCPAPRIAKASSWLVFLEPTLLQATQLHQQVVEDPATPIGPLGTSCRRARAKGLGDRQGFQPLGSWL